MVSLARSVALFASAALAVACGEPPGTGTDAPLPEPDFVGEVKADVADRVAMRGALVFGSAAEGAFTEDLQFEAWTLDVRAGARVDLEVTHAGTSSKLDSTMFVYGPRSPAGEYGASALGRDDDSGWGRNPRLRGLTLSAGGQYLVVLGTHDGAGRGKYRLQATCASGECAPPVVSLPTSCPEVLARGVLACTIGQVMDPGLEPRLRPTPEEGLETCLGADGFAGPYDAACAAEPAEHCGLPFERAWASLSGLCRDRLGPSIRRDTCTFGDSWGAIGRTPGIAVTRERTARQTSHFVGIEKQQVVAAMKAAGHADVRSATAALARADGHEIHLVDLWDESRGEAFLGIEFGAGDTSVGAIFARASTEVVVRNGDGDFYECTLPPGPRGGDCKEPTDCAGGLTCQGLSEESGLGRCVAQTRREGAGNPCSLSQDCGTDTGLVCGGLTRAPQSGLCTPAWMRNTFFPVPGALRALAAGGGTLEFPIEIRGLATVDLDVWLHAVVQPAAPTALRVELINHAGASVQIFEGRSDSLWLNSPVLGFSGDEYVNGAWKLLVTDLGGAGVTVEQAALTIGSRWD